MTTMNVKKLRKNKMRTVAMLRRKGVSVRQIAILLYGNDSESAQKRVAALISKLRKKLELMAGTEPQPSRHQPQPQLLNLKNTDFAPQPQPQKANRAKGDSTVNGDKIVDEKYEAQGVKQPEMVEKGKAAVTVFNWLDEDALARELADECYEKAKKCYKEKDYENTCRFMELVTRFLRLSQTARKEYDIEELKKVVEEEYE